MAASKYSTVQYSGLLSSTGTNGYKPITVQYSTVQYSTVQYSTVQYSTVQPKGRTGLNSPTKLNILVMFLNLLKVLTTAKIIL